MGSMLKIWIHLLKNELAPRFYGTIVEEILAVTPLPQGLCRIATNRLYSIQLVAK